MIYCEETNKYQLPKIRCLLFEILVIEIYLRFGIWCLEFLYFSMNYMTDQENEIM